MSHVTLTGGYGRDYQTADDAIQDWNADKDFEVHTPGLGGKYVNKQQAKDLKSDGFSFIRIRFSRKTKSVDVNL